MNGWPVFEISEEKQAFMNIESDGEEPGQAMGVDNLEDLKQTAPKEEEEEFQISTANAGGKWKNDLDVEFSDEEEDEEKPAEKLQPKGPVISSGNFVVKENNMPSYVRKNSNIAAEFAAAGLFKEAMEKLETQIGVKKGDTFSKQFADLYIASQMFYSTMSFVPTHTQYLTPPHNPNIPLVANNLKAAEKKLNQAYNKTTQGSFEEAIQIFRDILISIPLLSLNSKSDVVNAEKLVKICTEYIVSLSCDAEKTKAVSCFNPRPSLNDNWNWPVSWLCQTFTQSIENLLFELLWLLLSKRRTSFWHHTLPSDS